MSDYYERLAGFGAAIAETAGSVWGQECVVIACCGVYAEFETFLTQDRDPHISASRSLEFWTEYLRRVRDAQDYYRLPEHPGGGAPERADLEARHQTLWGDIWPRVGTQTLEELKAIIRRRLTANGLDRAFFGDRAVIDLGCGGGRFAFVAKEYGARKVLGIDFNAQNVEFANRAAAEQGMGGIECQLGSVYATGEPDASYDIVISNGVFHHLQDPQAAYDEAARLLKSGGQMFLYVEAKGGLVNELQETIEGNIGRIPRSTVFEVLTRLGFSDHSRINLMDFFFAHYEYAPAETIYARLRKAGFGRIEELKGAGMAYDRGYFQKMKDPWRDKKYGDGQLRLLAWK